MSRAKKGVGIFVATDRVGFLRVRANNKVRGQTLRIRAIISVWVRIIERVMDRAMVMHSVG